jgi:serine/threonine protein kinase
MSNIDIKPELPGYEITSKLGEGGFGAVYLAKHVNLQKNVAIKVIKNDASSSDDMRLERFRREARLMAQMDDHDNIVDVFDLLEDNRGDLCIVLEYVDGQTLHTYMQQGETLPLHQAADIVCQVAHALGAAHEKGIIHRDIKPDNIMITAKGQVKVMDFGIARFLGSARKTRTGFMVGTPHYMSPEQWRSEKSLDARADIYSLSAVLFEMACGQPPFHSDDPFALGYLHINEAPPMPAALNPEIPAELEAAILKGLEKEPDDRFKTAEEMRRALLKLWEGNAAFAGKPKWTKSSGFKSTGFNFKRKTEGLVQPKTESGEPKAEAPPAQPVTSSAQKSNAEEQSIVPQRSMSNTQDYMAPDEFLPPDQRRTIQKAGPPADTPSYQQPASAADEAAAAAPSPELDLTESYSEETMQGYVEAAEQNANQKVAEEKKPAAQESAESEPANPEPSSEVNDPAYAIRVGAPMTSPIAEITDSPSANTSLLLLSFWLVPAVCAQGVVYLLTNNQLAMGVYFGGLMLVFAYRCMQPAPSYYLRRQKLNTLFWLVFVGSLAWHVLLIPDWRLFSVTALLCVGLRYFTDERYPVENPVNSQMAFGMVLLVWAGLILFEDLSLLTGPVKQLYADPSFDIARFDNVFSLLFIAAVLISLYYPIALGSSLYLLIIDNSPPQNVRETGPQEAHLYNDDGAISKSFYYLLMVLIVIVLLFYVLQRVI